MAGGYGHLSPTPDGAGTRGGWSLIENMGDAYESTEQLLWLVFFFAGMAMKTQDIVEIDKTIQHVIDTNYYPMCRNERQRDHFYEVVERIMES
jgi:hypothetical protein